MQANAEKAPGSTFERIAEVRAFPGRKPPLSIVHAFSAAGAELAVQERYAKSATGLDDAALGLLEEDARRAMAIRHPNVACVRDVTREGEEVSIVSEFVEGEVLEEVRRLATASTSFTLEVGVRVIVDVLSALSALHTLGEPGLAHGEVTTNNIVVGYDGATRLLRPYRGRVAGRVAEADWYGYAAPEVLKGTAPDPRSDLFSIGVLLWETLTRRKLFPKATREGRTSRSVPIGKPTPPAEASWATPLVAVAERALATDPKGRYASAAEMAAAVRLAVRSKLAMPPRVAAVVDKLAGERILQRRTALALPEPTSRPSGRPSRPSIPSDAVRVLDRLRPSSRPPTPKPGAVAMPVVPRAPAVPSIAISTADARMGPRPAAPPLKLAELKPPVPALTPRAPGVAPPVPKVSAGAIAPPLPTPILNPILGAARGEPELIEPEPSGEFGIEPPTIPRKKNEAVAAALALDEVAAPPADLLDVVKAFEGKLDPNLAPRPAARAPQAPEREEVASVMSDAGASEASVPTETLITSPAPIEPPGLGATTRQPSASSIAPAGIGAQRGRRILIGVAALCGLLLVGAVLRLALGRSGGSSVADPNATTSVSAHTAHAPTTHTATATATHPAATGTAPVPTASDSSDSMPEDSASGSATPTSSAPAPEGSHRHHPRPRPTYDPMGI